MALKTHVRYEYICDFCRTHYETDFGMKSLYGPPYSQMSGGSPYYNPQGKKMDICEKCINGSGALTYVFRFVEPK